MTFETRMVLEQAQFLVAWMTLQDVTKSYTSNNCRSSQHNAIQQHVHFPWTSYESPSVLLGLTESLPRLRPFSMA